jgi:hypothetical protein
LTRVGRIKRINQSKKRKMNEAKQQLPKEASINHEKIHQKKKNKRN